jgi:hypothetical protein
MEINILTWNVDWFRNGKHSGKTDAEYIFNDCDVNAFNNICEVIESYFKEQAENQIVFLQEVPYKYISKENNWLEHSYWTSLLRKFPNNKYDVFLSEDDKGGYVIRKTIAIARKEVFVQINLNHNRLVAVKKDNIKLIGVHMPIIDCLNEDNDNVWLKLLDFMKKEKTTIIAGDFNTHFGCNSKSTEYRYKELLDLADNLVVESIPTFNSITSIDKILVGKNLGTKMYGVIPQEKLEDSDHRYIKARIVI